MANARNRNRNINSVDLVSNEDQREVVVNTVTIASLDKVLMAVFEPLASILSIDAKRGDAAQDTGQQSKDTGDIGMKIVVGQMIGTLHQQLHGKTTTSGAEFKNLSERLTEAETTLQRYITQYERNPEDFAIDNKAMTALWWRDQFQARYEALSELKGALLTVYERFTHETWKPYVAPEKKPVTVVDEPTKARIASLFKKTDNGNFVPKEAVTT